MIKFGFCIVGGAIVSGAIGFFVAERIGLLGLVLTVPAGIFIGLVMGTMVAIWEERGQL